MFRLQRCSKMFKFTEIIFQNVFDFFVGNLVTKMIIITIFVIITTFWVSF